MNIGYLSINLFLLQFLSAVSYSLQSTFTTSAEFITKYFVSIVNEIDFFLVQKICC